MSTHPAPIGDHTVPWPDDVAADHVAKGYWAGAALGTLLRAVADSLPAGHNFPLACPGILGTLLAGGRVVLLPSPEPARAFATVAAEGVMHTAVVPAVAARWLDHAEGSGAGDLASLRVLQVGGLTGSPTRRRARTP